MIGSTASLVASVEPDKVRSVHGERSHAQAGTAYADLESFPPTLIQVGACETLLADSARFAAAAGSANVDVTLEIWPDMIHAWPMWNARLEPGRRALARAGEFILRHLFG